MVTATGSDWPTTLPSFMTYLLHCILDTAAPLLTICPAYHRVGSDLPLLDVPSHVGVEVTRYEVGIQRCPEGNAHPLQQVRAASGCKRSPRHSLLDEPSQMPFRWATRLFLRQPYSVGVKVYYLLFIGG